RRGQLRSAFPGTGHSRAGQKNLRAGGLGLDDGGPALPVSRLEAGERISKIELGQLLRTDDALSAGDRLAHAPDSGGDVVGLETALVRIRGHSLHQSIRPALHSPVFARVV